MLFHVKDVFGHFLRFQAVCFCVLEGSLGWRLFIEHHHSQHRFRHHLQPPLLEGQQLLEGEEIRFVA